MARTSKTATKPVGIHQNHEGSLKLEVESVFGCSCFGVSPVELLPASCSGVLSGLAGVSGVLVLSFGVSGLLAVSVVGS